MLPDLGRLCISQIRDVGVHHQPDPKRQRLSTEPMEHGKALPNKPEWVRSRPKVAEQSTFNPTEAVNEYRAVDSWQREFQCDVMKLASELGMSSNTWTPEERRDILTLENARKHQELIAPDKDPLRECALRAIKRLPLGLTPGEFWTLVQGLTTSDGIKFIFAAMPIEPVQGQYSLIDDQKSGVVLFISNSSATSDDDLKQRILDSVGEKGGSQLDKGLVFNKDVFEAVRGINTPMFGVGIERGSSNIGSIVQKSDVEALHNAGLFGGIANALLKEDEKDVISQMAYRTGIWKRTTKERLMYLSGEADIDHAYETYYTLRSALAGVSMPVYAVDINQPRKMVVLMESGISDLKDKAGSVDSIIDNITRDVGAQGDSIKGKIGEFLERRLASASLATGEIGLLLTDSKPGNFLFQKCYYQIDVPYKENENIDLGKLPVCVMATDIDPRYSFWFEHRQGVYLQQVVSPESKEPSYETQGLPLIDPQCVRYCNMAIFAMAAMCRGIEWSWGIYMYNHCLIQANRYKNANNQQREGEVCLKAYYLSGNDVLLDCIDKGEHLADWGHDEYNPENGRGKDKFNEFVTNLADLVGERINHYGMERAASGDCNGPLRVANSSILQFARVNILGKVVAWMIEKAYNEANSRKR